VRRIFTASSTLSPRVCVCVCVAYLSIYVYVGVQVCVMYVWPSPSTPRRRRRSPRRVRVSVRPPAQSVGNAAPVPLAGIVRFAHPSLTPLSPARLSSDLLRLEATVA